jgi:hypothetical protein
MYGDERGRGAGGCCWHVCGREGWVWCCGGSCWEWFHGDAGLHEVGSEKVDGVELCESLETVCSGDGSEFEVGRVREEKEQEVEREGRYRDEWECDFCGVECFCKFQRFSERE